MKLIQFVYALTLQSTLCFKLINCSYFWGHKTDIKDVKSSTTSNSATPGNKYTSYFWGCSQTVGEYIYTATGGMLRGAMQAAVDLKKIFGHEEEIFLQIINLSSSLNNISLNEEADPESAKQRSNTLSDSPHPSGTNKNNSNSRAVNTQNKKKKRQGNKTSSDVNYENDEAPTDSLSNLLGPSNEDVLKFHYKEASKLSEGFIRHIIDQMGKHFDFTTTRLEPISKESLPMIYVESIKIAGMYDQNVEGVDNLESEATILYYRPMLWVNGEPSIPEWHDHMHTKAKATFNALFEFLQKGKHLRREIIFVGLDNGGAQALLHACMLIREMLNNLAVPWIKNQIKVITFETPSIFTRRLMDSFSARAKKFPLEDKNHLCFVTNQVHLSPHATPNSLVFDTANMVSCDPGSVVSQFSHVGFIFRTENVAMPSRSIRTDDVLVYLSEASGRSSTKVNYDLKLSEEQTNSLIIQLSRYSALQLHFSGFSVQTFRKISPFYLGRNAHYVSNALEQYLMGHISADDNLSNNHKSDSWRSDKISVKCTVSKFLSPKLAEIECTASLNNAIGLIARFAVFFAGGNKTDFENYSRIPPDNNNNLCYSKLFENGAERTRLSPFHFEAYQQNKKYIKPGSTKLYDFIASVATKPSDLDELLISNPAIFYRFFASPNFAKPNECRGILVPSPISGSLLGNGNILRDLIPQYIQQLSAGFNQMMLQRKEEIPKMEKFSIVKTKSNLGSESTAAHKFVVDNRETLIQCLNPISQVMFYDCRKPLTQWASDGHCPDICMNQSDPNTRMCSRIAYCAGGESSKYDMHILVRGMSYVFNPYDKTYNDFDIFDTAVSPYLGSFVLYQVDTKVPFDTLGVKSKIFFGFFFQAKKS